MFDLFTGRVHHLPSTPAISILLSGTIQTAALSVILVTSFIFAARELPAVPDVLAFVAELPEAALPVPPPPPRVPAQARGTSPKALPAGARSATAFAAPIEAPRGIVPEPIGTAMSDIGVPGGVEGGIEGGIVAGMVGSVPATIEGPPPPPPLASREPVRIGGQLEAPALLKRVEPAYPAIAQLAAIEGIVILEAIIDVRGRVQSVKVLRGHPLLAKAAVEAVQQWEYEPLKLNGVPTPFELTVSLSFRLEETARKRPYPQ